MEDKKLKELQKKIEQLAEEYGVINGGFFGSIEDKEDTSYVGCHVRVNDMIDSGFNAARFYQFTREKLGQYLRDMENRAQGKEK